MVASTLRLGDFFPIGLSGYIFLWNIPTSCLSACIFTDPIGANGDSGVVYKDIAAKKESIVKLSVKLQ